MRTINKIILAAAVAGAVLTLFGCSEIPEEATAPAPEPSATPTAEPLSAADKAAVDAHGTDVAKLLSEWQKADGTRKGYAEQKLIAAIEKSEDPVLIDKIAGLTEPSLPKFRAITRKRQLQKK